MARQVIVVDDVTGETGAEERHFAVGADAYKVDLTTDGWDELRKALAPWLQVAQRVGVNQNLRGVKKSTTPPPAINDSGMRHSREECDELRAWAAENGVKVREDGGRYPEVVWNAFHAKDVSLVPGRLLRGHSPQQYHEAS